MKISLEHINMNSTNIDKTAQFLMTAFPTFYIRGEGEDMGIRWLHVGDDETYICVNEVEKVPQGSSWCNHFGFQVKNVDEICKRLKEAGYREGYKVSDHPVRRRKYFLDHDGHEYEFIEYLTDQLKERNSYV